MLLLLAGCSLGPRPEVCDAHASCRDAFGLGWTCGDEGYCEEPVANPRCETWPGDLLARPDKYADALVLGTLFDRQTDQPQVRSAELAVRQVNENGGLDGRSFGVVHCGYEADPALDDLEYEDAARAAARYLVDELGVRVIIGPATSDQSAVVFDEVAGDDVLLVSPSATSPLLTTIDGETSTDELPGLFWRTAPPDDLQGAVIADQLEADARGAVAVIYDKGAYGTALADVIERNLDPSVGLHRFSFTNDTTLTEALVDAVFVPQIEEVVFLSGDVEDLIAFLNGAATQDRFNGAVERLPIFFADAAADPYLLDQTAAAADLYDQIRGTRPQVPAGPVYDTFQAAYSAQYDGQDPSAAVYASFSFDAAWLAMYGVAWATLQEEALTGTAVARGLRRVSDGVDTVPVRASSWSAVVDAFREGASVDLEGASGPLDFDPVTGETSLPIEVWEIVGGDFVAVP